LELATEYSFLCKRFFKLNDTDQRYNETNLVNSVNTTGNIQNLLNDTGIYSTYNLTYNLWAYNQTTATFEIYNSSWDNQGLIIIEENERVSNDSYLQGQIDSIVSYNSTFNQSLTDSLYAPVNYGDNWNKTYANTLYYSISNPNNYINLTSGQVFNDTSLILVVNSSLWDYINTNEVNWLSTYNLTYAGLINNGSYLSTYNATYDAYKTNVSINYTLQTYDTYDSRWYQVLWDVVFNNSFSNRFDSLFGAKDTDDLTQGSSNFYDNQSWNESLSKELHYLKSEVDTNLSLYLLTTDQRYNETDLALSINTTENIKTLSFYDKSEVDNNFTLYLLLTDQRYNETNLVNSINTSANIEALGFYTEAEVDANLSLYLLLTDQRYNETNLVNSVNTTGNIQKLGFYTKSEIDNNFTLYYTKAEVDVNLSNYILKTSEGNLNVNYSTWWAGVSGYVSGWFQLVSKRWK